MRYVGDEEEAGRRAIEGQMTLNAVSLNVDGGWNGGLVLGPLLREMAVRTAPGGPQVVGGFVALQDMRLRGTEARSGGGNWTAGDPGEEPLDPVVYEYAPGPVSAVEVGARVVGTMAMSGTMVLAWGMPAKRAKRLPELIDSLGRYVGLLVEGRRTGSGGRGDVVVYSCYRPDEGTEGSLVARMCREQGWEGAAKCAEMFYEDLGGSVAAQKAAGREVLVMGDVNAVFRGTRPKDKQLTKWVLKHGLYAAEMGGEATFSRGAEGQGSRIDWCFASAGLKEGWGERKAEVRKVKERG